MLSATNVNDFVRGGVEIIGGYTNKDRELCWYNVILIPIIHSIGIAGIIYMTFWHFDWRTLGLALLWFIFCSISITGGYHRLFSHDSYQAVWPVRFFLLMFGAASAQGSVEQWVSTHKQHHEADTNPKIEDPHDIKKSFRYAHWGWLFYEMPEIQSSYLRRLREDKLAMWQTKEYGWLMIFWGFALPGWIGWLLWDDALGALLVAGFTRATIQWHITWCINSVSHYWGENTFQRPDESRNNYLYAKMLVSFGEAYHSFHHQFPGDYRNGWKWWHLDPTKWLIFGLFKLKLVKKLGVTPPQAIEKALERAKNRQSAV